MSAGSIARRCLLVALTCLATAHAQGPGGALLQGAGLTEQNLLDALTPREPEVLGEMALGKSNAAIAAALVLSERAVEKHTNSIFSKLGLSEERDLNRRVSAVLVYLHNL